jgi:hypothetical protein
MSTYPNVITPEAEANGHTAIVPWGPGWDTGVDGVDVLLIGHVGMDHRPDGGTVAELSIVTADGTNPEVISDVGVELTIGDLMALGNWAYDRVIEANGTDETAGRELQYLQVAPVMRLRGLDTDGTEKRLDPQEWDGDDSDISLMQCETTEDMKYAAIWTVYARFFDPSDGFVKAEALRDYEILYAGGDEQEEIDEAKHDATSLAFLLSAGRYPIEVIDPRG